MTNKEKVRLKLLKCIPRTMLDSLIDSERRPWHFTRSYLEQLCLQCWNDEMQETVIKYLKNKS